jgi:hypothetical protein
LFAADRATLQTRVVLAVMKGFDLRMDQIHNDTTSVRGTYDGQNAKAIQLKRGHSNERRAVWCSELAAIPAGESPADRGVQSLS